MVLIIGCLSAGIYAYQKWPSELLWGIFFVTMFVVVPALMIVNMRLWTRCPRCLKYGTIQTVSAELQRKGIDPDLPPDHPFWKKEESSLDLSLDLFDLLCRYRCNHCTFEWEEKPPPSYKLDSPPPPYENEKKGRF